MTNSGLRRGQCGFTLIEMLVVLALMAALMFFSIPAILPVIHQSKLTGIASEIESLMRLARLNAMKGGAAGQAVVRILPPTPANPIGQVQAFMDPNADGTLNANETVLATFPLPRGVTFMAPPNLTDAASVAGFSPDPGGAALPRIAIFRADGTLDDGGAAPAAVAAAVAACGPGGAGAFRLADDNGNFLEVCEKSPTTPKPFLRMWLNGEWLNRGEKKETWQWN
jgi:prepilin-type N-terminal cleavage/methylation domain-containing protein